MRNPILSTTLLLVLGGGIALADDTAPTKAPPQPASMDVFFDTDSADLTATNDDTLKAMADWAKCKSTHVIKLDAHADKRGSVAYNADLSERRAEAVSNKLIELGAPRDRVVITVYGKLGEQRPTLAENRRVGLDPEKVNITASR